MSPVSSRSVYSSTVESEISGVVGDTWWSVRFGLSGGRGMGLCVERFGCYFQLSVSLSPWDACSPPSSCVFWVFVCTAGSEDFL